MVLPLQTSRSSQFQNELSTPRRLASNDTYIIRLVSCYANFQSCSNTCLAAKYQQIKNLVHSFDRILSFVMSYIMC